MNIKLLKKTIIPIIFIIIFILLTFAISYKNERIENLSNIPIENIIINNSYDFLDDKIKIIQEENTCIKNECNKVCNYVILPENFTFDTQEKIRDYIEEFFILYLNILDVECINNKIKKYIGPELTMGKIFKLKNLSLNSFSPLTNILIDNIYFANNIQINEIKLNNFGLFKLVKNKFDMKLKDYKYYYNSNFQISLIKNTIKPEMEEILNKNILSEDSQKSLNNILDCTDSKCIIYMNSLYFYDIVNRLSSHLNINLQNIRNDLNLNMNTLIELCHSSIIIDLFLKYNNINNIDDLANKINYNNINFYNSIRENIINNINTIKSDNYNIADFKKYISLNI